MILNDGVVFYHASHKNLTTILPTKTVSNDHNGKVHQKKYGCLSSSPAQAMYWIGMLNNDIKADEWYIYEVKVPHGYIVENCIGGYHFEGKGKLMSAMEVFDHKDVDGEVNIFEELPVHKLYAKVSLK